MTETTRIAIVGAAGRMGLEVLAASEHNDHVRAVAAIGSPRTEGETLGPQGLVATTDLSVFEEADVVIDFSTPGAFDDVVRRCVASRTALVSGTTGLNEEQVKRMNDAAAEVPIIWAANFSVGVNAIEHLVELASRATPGFDVEVFEAHHRNKVDAPSGTALFLGKAAARGRGVDLDEVAEWGRHGQTGVRSDDEIGFQVVRGGSIVGEHTVFFCGNGERLELTHRATDRAIFARGAVRAAIWLHGRTPDRYTMKDVLFSG